MSWGGEVEEQSLGNLIQLAIRLASLSRWLYITAQLQPSAPRPDAGQHRAGSIHLQAPSCFLPTLQPWIRGPEVRLGGVEREAGGSERFVGKLESLGPAPQGRISLVHSGV